jgi:hypothetical protein
VRPRDGERLDPAEVRHGGASGFTLEERWRSTDRASRDDVRALGLAVGVKCPRSYDWGHLITSKTSTRSQSDVLDMSLIWA